MELLLDPEALAAAKEAGQIPERKQFGPPKKSKVMGEGEKKTGEGEEKQDERKEGGVDAKKPRNDIGMEGSQSGEGSLDWGNASLGGDREPIEGDSTDESDKTYIDVSSVKDEMEIKLEELPDYA